MLIQKCYWWMAVVCVFLQLSSATASTNTTLTESPTSQSTTQDVSITSDTTTTTTTDGSTSDTVTTTMSDTTTDTVTANVSDTTTDTVTTTMSDTTTDTVTTTMSDTTTDTVTTTMSDTTTDTVTTTMSDTTTDTVTTTMSDTTTDTLTTTMSDTTPDTVTTTMSDTTTDTIPTTMSDSTTDTVTTTMSDTTTDSVTTTMSDTTTNIESTTTDAVATTTFLSESTTTSSTPMTTESATSESTTAIDSTTTDSTTSDTATTAMSDTTTDTVTTTMSDTTTDTVTTTMSDTTSDTVTTTMSDTTTDTVTTTTTGSSTSDTATTAMADTTTDTVTTTMSDTTTDTVTTTMSDTTTDTVTTTMSDTTTDTLTTTMSDTTTQIESTTTDAVATTTFLSESTTTSSTPITTESATSESTTAIDSTTTYSTTASTESTTTDSTITTTTESSTESTTSGIESTTTSDTTTTISESTTMEITTLESTTSATESTTADEVTTTPDTTTTISESTTMEITTLESTTSAIDLTTTAEMTTTHSESTTTFVPSSTMGSTTESTMSATESTTADSVTTTTPDMTTTISESTTMESTTLESTTSATESTTADSVTTTTPDMTTTISESTTTGVVTTSIPSTTIKSTTSESTSATESTTTESVTTATTSEMSTTISESTTVENTTSESTTNATESTTADSITTTPDMTTISESTTMESTTLESTTSAIDLTTTAEMTTTHSESTTAFFQSSTVGSTTESTMSATESTTADSVITTTPDMTTTISESTTMESTTLESTTSATESTTADSVTTTTPDMTTTISELTTTGVVTTAIPSTTIKSTTSESTSATESTTTESVTTATTSEMSTTISESTTVENTTSESTTSATESTTADSITTTPDMTTISESTTMESTTLESTTSAIDLTTTAEMTTTHSESTTTFVQSSTVGSTTESTMSATESTTADSVTPDVTTTISESTTTSIPSTTIESSTSESTTNGIESTTADPVTTTIPEMTTTISESTTMESTTLESTTNATEPTKTEIVSTTTTTPYIPTTISESTTMENTTSESTTSATESTTTDVVTLTSPGITTISESTTTESTTSEITTSANESTSPDVITTTTPNMTTTVYEPTTTTTTTDVPVTTVESTSTSESTTTFSSANVTATTIDTLVTTVTIESTTTSTTTEPTTTATSTFTSQEPTTTLIVTSTELGSTEVTSTATTTTTTESTTTEPATTTTTTESSTTEPVTTTTTTESTTTEPATTTTTTESTTTEPATTTTTTESSTTEPVNTTTTTESTTTEPATTTTTTESTTTEPATTTTTTESTTTEPVTTTTTTESTTTEPATTTTTTQSTTTEPVTTTTTTESTTTEPATTTTTTQSTTTEPVTTTTTTQSTTTEPATTTTTTQSTTTEPATTTTTTESSTTEPSTTPVPTTTTTTPSTTPVPTTTTTPSTTPVPTTTTTTPSTTPVPTTTTTTPSTTTATTTSSVPASLLSLTRYTTRTNFNNYGCRRGDDFSVPITLEQVIPIGDTMVRRFYIGSNGVISANRIFNYWRSYPLTRFTDRYYLAVLWVDLITYRSSSYMCSQVLTRTFDSTLLNDLSAIVSEFMGDYPHFEANYGIVASWIDVSLYAKSQTSLTFASVIITDGQTTFLVIFYDNVDVPTTYSNGLTTIGQRLGSTVKRNLYSRESTALKMGTHNGTVGDYQYTGYWLYKISEAVSPAARECYSWKARQRTFSWWVRFFLSCPCNLFIARLHPTLVPYYRTGRTSCFVNLRSIWGYTSTCCYNTWTLGFDTHPSTGGRISLGHPLFQRSLYYRENTLPKQQCSQANLINLFHAERPLSRCNTFISLWVAFFWGDPHIETLDGGQYTFNGYGEYILYKVENGTNLIEVQARTDLATNENGTTINATIFSGFAAKDETGSRFQVTLEGENKDQLVIFVNGEDHTTSFANDPNFKIENSNASFSMDNGSFVAQFVQQGVKVKVSKGKRLLVLENVLTPDFAGMTVGLLGNFDGNKSNDFILPNGTQLDANDTDTEREIYYNYGQYWAVNCSNGESLFTYPEGKSCSDYAFPNFVPFFVDEFSESERNAAKAKCGGESASQACIFDYLATKDSQLALESGAVETEAAEDRLRTENRNPTIEVDKDVIEVEVNKSVSIQFNGSDDSSFHYEIISQPDSGFQFFSGNGTAIWTPTSTNLVNISVTVIDDLNTTAAAINLDIILCSGCSGNGDCIYNVTVQTDNSLFQYATCECGTGWEGDNCEIDSNDCDGDPCGEGQNCTDLIPSEEVRLEIGYNCSECATGLVLIDGKCEDFDECNETSTNNCDQQCVNTEGSYYCTCNQGYRRIADSCQDINECAEKTSGCEQICTNTQGSFTCSCVYGFSLLSDGQCNRTMDVCQENNLTCSYTCDNSTGDYRCICRTGYKLTANGENCTDIDECTESICSQKCNNSVGSYTCSCFAGYQLNDDKTTCTACEFPFYGVNCQKSCQCGRGSNECDHIMGCVCLPGWTGTRCDTDINECVENPTICPSDQICRNLEASYACDCRDGFEKSGSNCIDINECSDEGLNNCTSTTSTCSNNEGGFTCQCKAGFNKVTDFTCTDIDECQTGSSGCTQKCKNYNGGFNCECNAGFVLDARDRTKCVKVEDVCQSFTNVNCSYGCKLENNAPKCYCRSGYQLNALDQQTCIDYNECSNSSLNKCSKQDSCVNTNGGYNCSCDVGYFLENDRRTCTECDSSHYGINCNTLCNCGVGASRCDNVRGCICKDGWTGEKCSENINECDSTPCTGPNERCVDTPGSFECRCKTGFANNTGTCEDINECDLGPCEQVCTNNPGSFTCSCTDGYQLTASNTCEDIDECTAPTKPCDQLCANTIGSFKCSCNPGYVIDFTTLKTCTIKTACTNTTCEQNCGIKTNGDEYCFCKQGYKLDANGINCTDIDECASNPCTESCTQAKPGSGYICSCGAGKFLNSDGRTCKECSDGRFGEAGFNCNQTCTCNADNSACDKINGTCYCRSGWEGPTCSQDIDECQNVTICPDNSQCQNTNGFYNCQCDVGYIKVGNTCTKCASGKYGANCAQTCNCNSTNTVSCNFVNGTCTCEPQWTGANCGEDFEECNQPQSVCSANSDCNELPGTYRCSCKSGYQATSPNTCEDIDECKTGTHNCSADASCTNTNGSYTCACNAGYSGDGYTCTAQLMKSTTTTEITTTEPATTTTTTQSTTTEPATTTTTTQSTTTEPATTTTTTQSTTTEPATTTTTTESSTTEPVTTTTTTESTTTEPASTTTTTQSTTTEPETTTATTESTTTEPATTTTTTQSTTTEPVTTTTTEITTTEPAITTTTTQSTTTEPATTTTTTQSTTTEPVTTTTTTQSTTTEPATTTTTTQSTTTEPATTTTTTESSTTEPNTTPVPTTTTTTPSTTPVPTTTTTPSTTPVPTTTTTTPSTTPVPTTTTTTPSTTTATTTSSVPASLLSLTRYTTRTNFNNYGCRRGDDFSVPITLEQVIPIGDTMVRRFYIGSNGVISANRIFNYWRSYPLTRFTDRYYLAVLWVDLITYRSSSYMCSQVLTRTFDSTLLNDLSAIVSEFMGDYPNFEANYGIVASWIDVSLYAKSQTSLTFASVIITDGQTTFLVVFYDNVDVPTTYSNGLTTIGQRLGSTVKRNLYSRESTALKMGTHNGTVGDKQYIGYWLYKISEAVSPAARQCYSWKARQRTFSWWVRFFLSCPCNLFIARLHPTLVPYYRTGRTSCFVNLRSIWGYTSTCCYNTWTLGFDTHPSTGGRISVGHPLFQHSLYYWENTLPKQQCSQANLINLFHAERPLSRCNTFISLWVAFFWGDPHIETLDGGQYTFNGYGEYILYKVENGTNLIEVQARTDLATNENGTTINATIFSGFAAKDETGSRFQVTLEGENKDQLVIFVNGEDHTTSFANDPNFKIENSNASFSMDNGSFVAQFVQQGVKVKVSKGKRLLVLENVLTPDFAGMTVGLLGNFDGNKSNDFILPNGTQLDANDTDTEREIYYNYGQYWAVNCSNGESLFTYPEGKSCSDYAFPNFVPFFVDEFSESERNAAKAKCGGESASQACIFDYLATKDSQLALESGAVETEAAEDRLRTENRNPTIEVDKDVIEVEVNKSVSIQFNGSDDSSFHYEIISQPDSGFQFFSGNGTAIWTPTSTNLVNISVTAIDDLNTTAAAINLDIILCSGCSGNGDCIYNVTVQTDNSLFQYATCECGTGWEGDNCEIDSNDCDGDPCGEGQNCTDLIPSEEVRLEIGYNCSECATGLVLIDGKCEDFDECNETSTNNCDQQCVNTEGSYYCTCNQGYRRIADSCQDINECAEKTSGCEQICTNTQGSFTCSCVYGFSLLSDGQCNRTMDVCQENNLTCSYTCDNSTGDYRCICRTGYNLTANGENCTDIDECTESICSQKCNNSVGSYTCSCFAGYQLNDDKTTCTACEFPFYGVNCQKSCQCGRGSNECDHIMGCVCLPGWTGTRCDTDINECVENPTICPSDQICRNLEASYACDCRDGFEKSGSNCIDINECSDEGLNNCTSTTSTCSNNEGGFTCQCKAGFNKVTDFTCTDIDECQTGSSGCTQKCKNYNGGFNCECNAGFVLDARDRTKCVKVEDVCQSFTNVNCSYGCKLENNAPKCYCQSGYQLNALDQQTCIDYNECSNSSLNKCSKQDSCVNTNGGYNCSCDVGYFLENDRRTCTECDSSHYGINCNTPCNCGVGASRCDNVRGCICKDGWTGDTCSQNINECDSTPCTGLNERCVDTPGSFECRCKTGFTNNTGTCEDINECDLGPCEQVCTNNPGSFTCSCTDGYQLTASNTCEDIDECTAPTKPCDQLCANTIGSFKCSCNPGYVIDFTTLKTCTIKTACTNTTFTCEQNCGVKSTGDEYCFCNQGYKLDANGINCTDIDECASNPCTESCTQAKLGSGYICSCGAGKFLNSDGRTCKECSDGRFGEAGFNCNQTCTCNADNSACDKINGTCYCRSGWEGPTCSQDIDECQNLTICPDNSQCQNTNGSYNCQCDVGYIKVGNTCTKCASGKYGANCAQTCNCNSTNTVSCNFVNGTCTCEPQWTGANCDEDVKECNQTQSVCSANSDCNELPGTYRCSCKSGYQATSPNTCEDIDECKTGIHNCSTDASCTNTNGSFTCACNAGYSGDGYTCTVCPIGTFGINCQNNCTCVTTNTNGDCNRINGTCTCLSGWEGSNCETDIDECSVGTDNCNTNLSSCSDTNGSFSCDCKYTKDSMNNCTYCSAGFYGLGCTNNCTCVGANTVGSCDPVDGNCTCGSGFEGNDCEKDINECTSGTHDCNEIVSKCNNYDGSFHCDCKYTRNSKGECDFCRPNTFGADCASDCTCIPDNTEGTCDNVTGACTCKEGWTESNCESDINECTQQPSVCNNTLSDCNNLNGTYECLCKYTNDSSGNCIFCPFGKYGLNCATNCSCVGGNTDGDCDTITGNCTCIDGWTGDNCETDVNECALQTSDCNATLSTCRNKDGGFDCDCKYTQDNLGNCTFCSSGKFGLNCTSNCTCVAANTIGDCNPVDGNCTCVGGWEGSNCETDINECTSTTHNCNTQLQDCRNTNGSFNCVCKYGTNSSTQQCADAPVRYTTPSGGTETVHTVTIVLNLTIGDFQIEYQTTLQLVNQTLWNLHSGTPGFISVHIVNMSPGSVNVKYDIITDNSNNDATANDIAKTLQGVVAGTEPVVYNGTNVSVSGVSIQSAALGTVNVSSTSDRCSIFNAFVTCSIGRTCRVTNDVASCELIETKDNYELIVGLGVGIPLFFISVILIAVVCVYQRKLRKSSSLNSSEDLDRTMNDDGFFRTGIPTKMGSWSRPAYYAPGGGWGDDSSVSEDGDRRGRRDDFDNLYQGRDVYAYDNGAKSNFSWDFMYEAMGPPGQHYQIKRPQTERKPHPLYTKNTDA